MRNKILITVTAITLQQANTFLYVSPHS